ncbi:unnamed protein product [Adineta steineri]|uniref:Uncharacterized protein n=1 Tax=Adineta steineri TaxID=433720 RepID=A0A818Z4V4_9BILA|nr:unnamed protein product [Adineta steineri]CAF3764178.1 unnamed protein product [Adineta steineri]
MPSIQESFIKKISKTNADVSKLAIQLKACKGRLCISNHTAAKIAHGGDAEHIKKTKQACDETWSQIFILNFIINYLENNVNVHVNNESKTICGTTNVLEVGDKLQGIVEQFELMHGYGYIRPIDKSIKDDYVPTIASDVRLSSDEDSEEKVFAEVVDQVMEHEQPPETSLILVEHEPADNGDSNHHHTTAGD